MRSSTFVCRGRRPWMGSLVEELRRREAAARAEADRLRGRIEELADDLARAEEQASRLAIAWEEVARVLEEPAVGQCGEPAGERRPASPIGAVTVPPWHEGAEALVLPRSYQDLLEVAADAGRPLSSPGPLRADRLPARRAPGRAGPGGAAAAAAGPLRPAGRTGRTAGPRAPCPGLQRSYTHRRSLPGRHIPAPQWAGGY
jgi:hypothetical protein